MKVEFTKQLAQDNFTELRLALNERKDNIDLNTLSSEKKAVLEKFQNSPHLVINVGDFVLLGEMAAETGKLWKKSETLKVFFFGGDKAKDEKVLQYASIWSDHCSIKFERTEKINEAKIRVGYESPGSWSFIGTDANGVDKSKATINFGWLSDSLSEREYKQVVLHEFGHALGLIHEHQSPDITIDWNKDRVYKYFELNYNWTKSTVDRNIFQEFEKTTTRYSVVDKDSIMGYYIPPEFTNDGQSFPLNYDLSEIDKKFIGELYPEILHS